MSLINVDLLTLATGGANYLASIYASVKASNEGIGFLSYHPSFSNVIGRKPTARKLADLPYEAFHEGGVYNKADNTMYISANLVSGQTPISMTKLSLSDYSITSTQFPGLVMANGGSSYYPPRADRSSTPSLQVWCDQGNLETYGQLVAVDVNLNKTTPLVVSYQGRNFSSLNDVRQHPVTGDLWFTDPDYGHMQKFRNAPQLPRHVYRFEPATGNIHVVADGFAKVNGLEFSPDYKTLYVSDTGAQLTSFDPTGPTTIYAYDIVNNKQLSNKRVFAFADSGFPDGIHTDTDGNVWAGCGDGLHIWNPEGTLVGKIYVGETSNNFAFAPGKVFVFANRRLWVVEGVKALGREVCKDFGVDSDNRCKSQVSK